MSFPEGTWFLPLCISLLLDWTTFAFHNSFLSLDLYTHLSYLYVLFDLIN
jgi:hypothetical protein